MLHFAFECEAGCDMPHGSAAALEIGEQNQSACWMKCLKVV